MMTPCEKLGYKVGDRFEVVTQSESDAQVGWVVVLYEDDGSICPFFYKVGEEFGRTYCPKLTKIRPLKTQTEAEKRGAKFGVGGVVKETGKKCVFVSDSLVLPGWWEILAEGETKTWHRMTSQIRLDHEPEYKEIPFSEATHEQRMNVDNLVHAGGRKVEQIFRFNNGSYAFTCERDEVVYQSTSLVKVRIPT